MRKPQFAATLGTLLLLSAVGASAQSGREVAQLPIAVTSAKTIFISNAGDSPIAYDAFCDGMKDWGRYEITSSASKADLIVELSYRDAEKGVTSPSGNAFVATRPIREKKVDAQVVVTIYDPRTNELLWSVSDAQKHAKREKNREREAIQSVQHLITDLEARTAASQ